MKHAILTLAIFAIAAMDLAGCKPAEPGLGASDLSGPANLADADRTLFTVKCVARRTDLFAFWFVRRTMSKPEEIQEMKGDIDEVFPRFCGCLEKELEKRVSKLQFRMAETMIGMGTFPDGRGSPIPEFEDLKKTATQLGMSVGDFESARRSFRVHARQAAEGCSLMLSGPAIARFLHLPEKNWYPGPTQ